VHCLAWISRLYLTSGPVVWNSFPEYLRDPTLSIDSCRHYFKTYFLLVINIQRLSALETAWLHALYHRSYCDYDCVTVSCVLLPVYDWWLLWLWLCDSQLRVITGIGFVIIVIVIVWQSVACYYRYVIGDYCAVVFIAVTYGTEVISELHWSCTVR